MGVQDSLWIFLYVHEESDFPVKTLALAIEIWEWSSIVEIQQPPRHPRPAAAR
jgi:hypothetical protein